MFANRIELPETAGLSAELRELGAGPLGGLIYFHEADGKIYKVGPSGDVTEAIPGFGNTFPPGFSELKNPAVFGTLQKNEETGELKEVEGSLWCITETDNPSNEAGQLYAWRLMTSGLGIGNWNGSNPIQVTDFRVRRAERPKVSRDGDLIMFLENPIPYGKAYLKVARGLQDILDGGPPYASDLGTKGETVVNLNFDGVGFPGGFIRNDFIFWSQDQNDVYRLTEPLNFEGADFDIHYAPISTEGGGLTLGKMFRKPLPGNQIGLSTSWSGLLTFSSDYPNEPIDNKAFNVYVTPFSLRVVARDGPLDTINGISHPSGLTFSGVEESTAQIHNPGISPLTITPSFKPISDAIVAGSALSSSMEFGPEGMYVINGPEPEAFRIKRRWSIEDLWREDGILNEASMTIYHNGVAIEPEDSTNPTRILEKNIAERWIKYSAASFSDYALGAPVIPLSTPEVTGLDMEHWSSWK